MPEYNQWISVKDRLPELHEDVWDDDGELIRFMVSDPVLVVYNGGEQAVAAYEVDGDSEKYWWVVPNCDELHTVTHWMPLPPLPKGV